MKQKKRNFNRKNNATTQANGRQSNNGKIDNPLSITVPTYHLGITTSGKVAKLKLRRDFKFSGDRVVPPESLKSFFIKARKNSPKRVQVNVLKFFYQGDFVIFLVKKSKSQPFAVATAA